MCAQKGEWTRWSAWILNSTTSGCKLLKINSSLTFYISQSTCSDQWLLLTSEVTNNSRAVWVGISWRWINICISGSHARNAIWNNASNRINAPSLLIVENTKRLQKTSKLGYRWKTKPLVCYQCEAEMNSLGSNEWEWANLLRNPKNTTKIAALGRWGPIRSGSDHLATAAK